jgi:regulator of sigma E protease
MQTFFASIFVFGLLILVHELGHYFVARLTGIRVLELAIGFGPKVIGWSKNDIDYSLRIFPLGGFCRLLGENPEEASEPDSFPKKPILSRAAVLLAGAGMNLILAIVVFFIIFFFVVGIPDTETARIGYIINDSPAETAGLEAGDLIIAIDGVSITTWDDVLMFISAKPNQKLVLLVERDGVTKELSIVSEVAPDSGRGMIGIGPAMQKYQVHAIPAS